jgi:hypothetical protein
MQTHNLGPYDIIVNGLNNDINYNNNNNNNNLIDTQINLYDDDDTIYNLDLIIPIKPKQSIVRVKKRVCKKKLVEEDEPMRMPAFADYDAFIQREYKVSELKEVCKHYGIKCSGTKQELKLRVHAHLIQSHFIPRIQRMVRRSYCKIHARMSGPAYHSRSMCVNDTDFYSMEPMSNIPRNQFISFKDDTGVVYGFDVMSLYTYYESELSNTGQSTPSNPYNRMPFPHMLRSQMYRKIKLTHLLGVACTIEVEPEPVLSVQQQDEQLMFLVFQQINSHGHYADTVWFGELNGMQIMRFMRELADIWNYRAQIMTHVKQEICPPNGDPFRSVDLRMDGYTHADSIKRAGIQIMNTFVSSGVTRDSRGLGAYYVLSALTLVSQPARNAMPWLYESVMYNAQ